MLTAEASNPEPLILAIETATRAGSVAVARGETLLSCREGDASISHSTNLIEMIDAVLNEAGAPLSDVDVFAVAVGPGSFTGLRIGLATVKAFAEVNQRPIAGISTLAAVAHASALEGDVVSLLPAGRGEVFAQMFSVAAGKVEAKDEPAHLSPPETIRLSDRVRKFWGELFSDAPRPKCRMFKTISLDQLGGLLLQLRDVGHRRLTGGNK